jgi:hypothetical protein
MRWLLTLVLGAVVLVLVLANAALFGLLAGEKASVSTASDSSCPQPGMDDSGPYTPSEWRWVPPGRACIYQGHVFDEPRWTRVVAVVGLPVALVGSIVVVSAQARRAMTESRARAIAGYG